MWNALSVQFSYSVVSNSLQHHELQHARPPCPSPTPRVYLNSCSLSWWCHPTISSSVVPFSCFQSFPALGSFQMSQIFTSSGQTIGVSASTSVLPMNIQDWFPLGWTGWISLMYWFPDLQAVCCSMSSSNCCFLTCIQISQEADQVVSYSHFFKNGITICCDPHSQSLWHRP